MTERLTVPLLDLGLGSGPHRAELDAAIARVLDSQRFILGPEVVAFETELADWLGDADRHVVGVSNGSDALMLALMALEIGPGDEVIVPAFTYAATATSVALVGARPVFVDVVEPTLELDVEALAQALSPRTRAVIPVHLYGRAVDWPALEGALVAAKRDDVALIEDAAQALGARVDGRHVAALGDLACVSFFPTKNLGAFGDGGAVTTPDPELADQLRRLRNHGRRGRDDHAILGLNARLDALQAAILRVRLPHLREWTAARRANAAYYREALAPLAKADLIRLPAGDGPDGRFLHVYHQFGLRIPAGRRDALQKALTAAGIETAIYYSRPVPEQDCLAYLGHRPGQFPVSERLARESLAIPVHPLLTEAQREHVAATLRAFFEPT